MASINTCDGCGDKVENPKVLGRTIPRDYCDECVETAQQFIDEEDALRKALYEKFIDDRAFWIATLSAGGFKLPDIQDGVG